MGLAEVSVLLGECQTEPLWTGKLNRRLAVLPAPPTAVPAHVLVEPGESRTMHLQRPVVLLPVGRSILRFARCIHAESLPSRDSRAPRDFVQQSHAQG